MGDSSDIVKKEMYDFTDKGGREVGCRRVVGEDHIRLEAMRLTQERDDASTYACREWPLAIIECACIKPACGRGRFGGGQHTHLMPALSEHIGERSKACQSTAEARARVFD